MVGLLRSRLTKNPLLFLCIALALGVLAGRYLPLNPKLIMIVTTAGTSVLALSCFACMRAKKSVAASALMASCFLIAGVALATLANRLPDPDRIKSILDSEALG